MISSRIVRFSLGVTIAALVAASVVTYWLIDRRQVELESFSRYNTGYAASQAVIEFQRFQKSLLQLERDRAKVDLVELKARFQILYNRTRDLTRGEFAEFTRDDAELARTAVDLAAVVKAIDPVLQDADVALNVRPMLSTLAPLEPRIIALAARTNRDRAERVAEHRATLLRLQQQFSLLTFGLILCALALVGALTWHNRLLSRAHRKLGLTTADLRETANDLATANRAVAAANEQLRRQNGQLLAKENALRAQNVLFDAALNNMSQGLCMFDDALLPLVDNAQLHRLFAAPPVDAIAGATGQPRSLRDLTPDLAPLLEENVREGRTSSFEVECSDGRTIAVAQQPMPQGGWVATFADVTDQRRAQARIFHMARHDGLTGLPNRYAFRERIGHALRAREEGDALLAVMCVDIDNFKEVNDTLGHPTGDALLCAAAQRLARTVREGDMVARFGGDEFAILLPHIDRFGDAGRLAARIVDEMRKPFEVDGESVHATASVGVAVSPKHGSDPDVLQKNADLALYTAKSDGKRTHRLFESAMDERLALRHVLERDLRGAIAGGELELYYQPIVHLRSGKMTGLEALIRWRHPVHGLVPPGKFIPIAEAAGLISEIGRWVLAQACNEASRWPSHLKVSVNLSVAQFAHGDIVEDIRNALSRAGLRPERLVVEITESLLLSESVSTLDALQRLKALRVAVAMDDFGTGYSSLSYLRKYSFDRIKIDRGFVSSASNGDKNAAIIRAIVQLGASLGMTTVAEGIETETNLDLLLAAGCQEGQGYLFSPPVPRDKLCAMIEDDLRRESKVA